MQKFPLFEAGAGDGTRTRDNLLGRQELYQLSYSRRLKLFYRKTKSIVKMRCNIVEKVLMGLFASP